ncbi:carotenoid-cleaving dioxygenase, mitochondrial-like [Glandiceps talaboti]
MSKPTDASCTASIANVFRSAEKEYATPIKTTVRGEIPKWLSGCLLRNGPGRFEFGRDSYHHFFDGSALMHKFNIRNGDVTYQSKFLQSERYKENVANNRIVMSEFGTVAHPDPCKNIFKRFFSRFSQDKPSDNCNVNWIQIGEDFFVATESNFVYKVDKETLETKEKVDLSRYIAVNGATAHPHQVDDWTYNIGSSYGSKTTYNIIQIGPPQRGKDPLAGARIICSIPARNMGAPSYYHSFGISDNYIVFLEQPLVISVLKILTYKLRGVPMTDSMDYHANKPARFHIVRRDTGEVLETQYVSDAFFCFHFINAYEENDQLVVDLCGYNNPQVFQEGSLSVLRDPKIKPYADSEVRRYVLPLTQNLKEVKVGRNLVTLDYTTSTACLQKGGNIHITFEKLFETLPGFELPRINYENYNGKKYRYAYGYVQGTYALGKCDFEDKTYKVWSEEHYIASEPVFVGSPNPSSEDDGVIIACMLSTRQDYWPYLIILDAKTFTEIARAEVPVYIPSHIHSIFVDDSKEPPFMREKCTMTEDD